MGFWEVMGYIVAALVFCAIGAAVSEYYNEKAWRKYYEGVGEGKNLRVWKDSAHGRYPLRPGKKEGTGHAPRMS